MLKTLIVEDNPTFRESLRETLHERFPSMTVDEVVDGEETLEKVDAIGSDLIFMDIKLPGENGLELTRVIKQVLPHTAITILTSYDLAEYRRPAYECGADSFLTKGSSTREELLALVDSVIDFLDISVEVSG